MDDIEEDDFLFGDNNIEDFEEAYYDILNKFNKEQTITFRYEQLLQYVEDDLSEITEALVSCEQEITKLNLNNKLFTEREIYLKDFLKKHKLSIEDLDEFITEKMLVKEDGKGTSYDPDILIEDCDCESEILDELQGVNKRIFIKLSTDKDVVYYRCSNCDKEINIKE